MSSEIDRIFNDHQKRVDAIWDKFESEVKADLQASYARQKTITLRLLVILGALAGLVALFYAAVH